MKHTPPTNEPAQPPAITTNLGQDTPAFERRANATLDRVRNTYASRGREYGDTWRDAPLFYLQSVLREFGLPPLDRPRLVALAAATLADVKYSRMIGGYKDDNLIDGIAYTACLAEAMKEVRG